MSTMKWLMPSAMMALLTACGGGAAPAPSPSSPAPASAPASVAKPAATAPASAKPASSAAASAKPAASAAASASTAAKPAASGLTKIVTATGVPSVVFTPVWVADEQGIFKKYGLDVSVTENLEGVKQAQAIIAGDVQIGNVGGAEILNAQVGGAKLEGTLQTTHSPLFELHAAPTYKRVEDFKGKTVAITATGSSTDLAARVLLQNHGLTPDTDVKLLQATNMPGIVAALVSKNV
ncbi:MAG: ABC transporter substrate-binding protein, partial [Chloroflexi bacterium]|nr:ABC transporter substrate-binding protein [Chloroflexota bacterium]